MEDHSFNSWMAGFWEGEGSINRLNELRYEIQKKKYYEEVDRKRKKDKYYNLKKELK